MAEFKKNEPLQAQRTQRKKVLEGFLVGFPHFLQVGFLVIYL
jgi:hypothetical protein